MLVLINSLEKFSSYRVKIRGMVGISHPFLAAAYSNTPKANKRTINSREHILSHFPLGQSSSWFHVNEY